MDSNDLHDYQKFGVEKILTTDRCGLLYDMGMGKTVTTLTAIDLLINEMFQVLKVLVIAPLRVAEDTWSTEQQKWEHLKDLRISKILGSERQRIAGLEADADVYIINRENVVWLVEYLSSLPKKQRVWPFDMIVVDELSSFKSSKSQRFRALRKAAPLADRFVGLTGTPAPNGLMDLWSQMYLIDGGERLFKTITMYRQVYFYPEQSNGHVVYKYGLRSGSEELIREKISDICVSLSAEDYLDMPELLINDIRVKLSKDEMAVYAELEKEQLLKFSDEENVTAYNAASLYGKLLQLANGGLYLDDTVTKVARAEKSSITVHKRKIEALRDIVEHSMGQPVLVFYNYKMDLALLKEEFKSLKPREMDGPKAIRDWNDGKIQMLLAQPQSMAHGLNLQKGGHIIIWYGLNPSLELYQQANARLYRQGQKEKTVIVHRIIAEGTVDEDVVMSLENKDEMQSSLVEALKARIKEVREHGQLTTV